MEITPVKKTVTELVKEYNEKLKQLSKRKTKGPITDKEDAKMVKKKGAEFEKLLVELPNCSDYRDFIPEGTRSIFASSKLCILMYGEKKYAKMIEDGRIALLMVLERAFW